MSYNEYNHNVNFTTSTDNNTYRIANPYDETQLPLRIVIPLARITKDDSIVKHLAHRRNLIVLKHPKNTLSPEDYNEYQALWVKHCTAVLSAARDPRHKEQAIRSCIEMIEAVAGVKQTIERDQLDIFGEEDED